MIGQVLILELGLGFSPKSTVEMASKLEESLRKAHCRRP